MPSHAKSPETQSSHASLTDVNVHTNLVYALWTGLIVVTTLVMGLVTLLEGNGHVTLIILACGAGLLFMQHFVRLIWHWN